MTSEEATVFKQISEQLLGDEKVDPMVRYAAANTIHLLWKMLNAQYGSMEDFLAQPAEEQRKFINGLEELRDKILEDEKNSEAPWGSAAGAWLSCLYIRAVALEDKPEAINMMADFLEPYNKLAFEMEQESE